MDIDRGKMLAQIGMPSVQTGSSLIEMNLRLDDDDDEEEEVDEEEPLICDNVIIGNVVVVVVVVASDCGCCVRASVQNGIAIN
jgi:hypothetical protein